MQWKFSQIFRLFQHKSENKLLNSCRHAFERECLRVDRLGQISKKKHPKGLGASLTNPIVKTDFSETQIEVVTPPRKNAEQLLYDLQYLLSHVFTQIEDEMLWPASMPGILPLDADLIPLAFYGNSNEALMRNIYRRGLSLRYGRKMQTICGIHYNFSLSKELLEFLYVHFGKNSNFRNFKDEVYLHMLRNFLRYHFVIAFLCGASPALDVTFVSDKPQFLEKVGKRTFLGRYATSLRMSSLGYTSEVQNQLAISYNSLADFISSLRNGLRTSWPAYECFGVFDNGEYRQLNSNILQLEAEFYAPIRLKQPPKLGERVLQALESRGVKYLEIRNIDNNPFNPLGIGINCLLFLHIFMMYCLFKESPFLTHEEYKNILTTINKVAFRGRDPSLTVVSGNRELRFSEFCNQILGEMCGIAGLLDQTVDDKRFSTSYNEQLQKFRYPQLTHSARIVDQLLSRNEDYTDFCLDLAKQHSDFLAKCPLSKEKKSAFKKIADQSWKLLAEKEKKSQISLDEYLKQYQSI